MKMIFQNNFFIAVNIFLIIVILNLELIFFIVFLYKLILNLYLYLKFFKI
jgi:hypothetical protein